MQAVLHAISEPRRREILRLVSQRELAATQIHEAFDDVTFGAISQHLRVLAEAELVDVRRDGRHRWYRTRVAPLESLRAWLDSMWTSSLGRLADLAEAEEAEVAEGERASRPAPRPVQRSAARQHRRKR